MFEEKYIKHAQQMSAVAQAIRMGQKVTVCCSNATDAAEYIAEFARRYPELVHWQLPVILTLET